jgi:glycosyltransferase involved in cell wall biosynthesis
MKKKPIINLIQTIPTPHNNVLIKQFLDKGVNLNLWYAHESNKYKYSSDEDLANKYYPAKIYGKKLNFFFLWYCIRHFKEQYVIVGWENVNTLLLHIIFFLFRRPFNHWTDMPKPINNNSINKAKIIRSFAYLILRNSKVKIFCVGKMTINYFKQNKFPEKNLVNLPIFVDVDNKIINEKENLKIIRKKFCNHKDQILISAGSRLVYEKGFDLLIYTIKNLPVKLKNKIKLVIVGNGSERTSLKKLIRSLNLKNIIKIEKFMKIENFKKLIACSDIFVHPARFDAYGSTLLGMSLGVPVIGSKSAGAALDRIKSGYNGYLYKADDIKTLANYIILLANSKKLRKRIGNAGKKTSSKWHPIKGYKILMKHLH